MKLLIVLFLISSCTYIHPIRKIKGPIKIERTQLAVNNIKLEINNLIAPATHHEKDLKALVDIEHLKKELISSLEGSGLNIDNSSSNVLTLDFNRFYVRGGPGWLVCRIDIFITARARINKLNIPPENFNNSRRVFFCSLSKNDERFKKEIKEMMTENITEIIQYVERNVLKGDR